MLVFSYNGRKGIIAFQRSHFLRFLAADRVVERKSQQDLILGSIDTCQVILNQIRNGTYSYTRLSNYLCTSFDTFCRNKMEKIHFSFE